VETINIHMKHINHNNKITIKIGFRQMKLTTHKVTEDKKNKEEVITH
jgi:hypothetical protein